MRNEHGVHEHGRYHTRGTVFVGSSSLDSSRKGRDIYISLTARAKILTSLVDGTESPADPDGWLQSRHQHPQTFEHQLFFLLSRRHVGAHSASGKNPPCEPHPPGKIHWLGNFLARYAGAMGTDFSGTARGLFCFKKNQLEPPNA